MFIAGSSNKGAGDREMLRAPAPFPAGDTRDRFQPTATYIFGPGADGPQARLLAQARRRRPRRAARAAAYGEDARAAPLRRPRARPGDPLLRAAVRLRVPPQDRRRRLPPDLRDPHEGRDGRPAKFDA